MAAFRLVVPIPVGSRRVVGIAVALAALLVVLTACTSGTPSGAAHAVAKAAPTISAVPTTRANVAPVSVTTKVPTNLVGKTMRAARADLSAAGFTHVTVAGRVTDSTTVTKVSHAGESVPPDTTIVLTGRAAAGSRSNHCGDPDYWNRYGTGDPGTYVQACGVWPSWIDRGSTPCLPGEHHCHQTRQSAGATGCGQRAVDAGRFDASCKEYQGYLDPGTRSGRKPTSGETQAQWGCRQGYIPKSQC